jgi:RNA polymerase sigma-70 factor (ECF subfamily)
MTAVKELSTPPPEPSSGDQQTLGREQIGRLVAVHQGDLWRYIRYLGATADEADDLVQETFLALARSGFEERSVPETAALVRTAGRRRLLMLRRKQQREIHAVELDAAETVWAKVHTTGSTDPLLDALRDCVATLDGKAKQIIDLHYTQQLSRSESAKQIGITAEGVKTLLRRTRTALRQCVERKTS